MEIATGRCTSVVVSIRLRVVVTSGADKLVHVFSLDDGREVRTIKSHGEAEGQFHWQEGFLCLTPRDTLLATEYGRDRLQELDIGTGVRVRLLGEGELRTPQHVHCRLVRGIAGCPLDGRGAWRWRQGVVASLLGEVQTCMCAQTQTQLTHPNIRRMR